MEGLKLRNLVRRLARAKTQFKDDEWGRKFTCLKRELVSAAMLCAEIELRGAFVILQQKPHLEVFTRWLSENQHIYEVQTLEKLRSTFRIEVWDLFRFAEDREAMVIDDTANEFFVVMITLASFRKERMYVNLLANQGMVLGIKN